MFDTLQAQPTDSLLALIKAYRADPRTDKLDLGVGVYRDETGATPILRAVKAAEKHLLETQETKAYLGPEGDPFFTEALMPIVFGARMPEHVCGVQTPGGSGALRLGAELLTIAHPGARILIGTPTWPNHVPVLAAGGLGIVEYPYFDIPTQTLLFDQMLDGLSKGQPGDIVLLHGCCHNPTGADLDMDQWRQIAELVAERGLFPFIDLAYQGLGRGLEPDAAGMRLVIDAVPESLIAFSCDKNFGLYRDRVGALYAVTQSAEHARTVESMMSNIARVNWSMPPDHGAAVVRTILGSNELRPLWHDELVHMCARVIGVRAAIAAVEPRLAFLEGQRGLFSNLALTKPQVARIRTDFGIYMAGSGRINLAGMQAADAATLCHALVEIGLFA